MITKALHVAASLLAAALLVGCSDSKSGAHSPGGSGAYPKDAVAVTTNPAYKVGFFSGLTGISYYVRPLGKDEVATMPREYVFSDEKTSVLVVPIKDGKIVEFTGPDRAGSFFSKTPEEMLK